MLMLFVYTQCRQGCWRTGYRQAGPVLNVVENDRVLVGVEWRVHAALAVRPT